MQTADCRLPIADRRPQTEKGGALFRFSAPHFAQIGKRRAWIPALFRRTKAGSVSSCFWESTVRINETFPGKKPGIPFSGGSFFRNAENMFHFAGRLCILHEELFLLCHFVFPGSPPLIFHNSQCGNRMRSLFHGFLKDFSPPVFRFSVLSGGWTRRCFDFSTKKSTFPHLKSFQQLKTCFLWKTTVFFPPVFGPCIFLFPACRFFLQAFGIYPAF